MLAAQRFHSRHKSRMIRDDSWRSELRFRTSSKSATVRPLTWSGSTPFADAKAKNRERRHRAYLFSTRDHKEVHAGVNSTTRRRLAIFAPLRSRAAASPARTFAHRLFVMPAAAGVMSLSPR